MLHADTDQIQRRDFFFQIAISLPTEHLGVLNNSLKRVRASNWNLEVLVGVRFLAPAAHVFSSFLHEIGLFFRPQIQRERNVLRFLGAV